MTTLHNVYFSGKGTTQQYAEGLADVFKLPVQTYDWLSKPPCTALNLTSTDVLLFSMPVYGGFIPQFCAQKAKYLHGQQTPAIIVAVYGNRHYDFALRQMQDLLTAQGFIVLAAGAFVAEHSIFPAVATGRPDEQDKKALTAFAQKCKHLLANPSCIQQGKLEVPGTADYNPATFTGGALKPDVNNKCARCGACALICPQGAIPFSDPRKTDASRCISCGACIRICPAGARGYHSEHYREAARKFIQAYSAYRKPEVFFWK